MKEVKKKEWQKWRRMKRKEVKRAKKKRRKKRTKRRLLKEDVTVLLLWKPLEGEIWRVVVIFLGKTPWRSLRTGLIVNLTRVRVCMWCLM